MMAFDYKKEHKELYQPPQTPVIVEIPPMNFIAVPGKGDPNLEDGEYSGAMNLLYGVAYTLKMSYKGDYKIDGFFEYVVPPLEGLWWQEEMEGVDYSRKETFHWISLIRLPDFVSEADVDWAKKEAGAKKKIDFSAVRFYPYAEGLCVQSMHIGPYQEEPATILAMADFTKGNGYALDITKSRHHHEIYLADPRKTAAEKLKTVIRLPIRKLDEAKIK
jgi:Uncharacterized conserved protein